MKEQLARVRAWRNDANKQKRAQMKMNERLGKRMTALVNGSYSSKAPAGKLRADVKEKIEAAQADTVEAEEKLEQLLEDTEGLRGHLDTIQQWTAKKSGGVVPVPEAVESAMAAAREEAGEAAAAAASGVGSRKRRRKTEEKAGEKAGEK